MRVIAMDDSREGVRGYFAGFTGPTLSDWYLCQSLGGEREKFACDQLEIPPETAELCMTRGGGGGGGSGRGRITKTNNHKISNSGDHIHYFSILAKVHT